MSAFFAVEVTDVDGWTLVTPSGELDYATADRLAGAIDTVVVRGARRVIADLSRLDFIDSSGVGALVRSHRRLGWNGGELRVVAPDGPTTKILRLTGLGRVLPVYGSVVEAVSDRHDDHRRHPATG